MLTLPINRFANLFVPVFIIVLLLSSLNSLLFYLISMYYYLPYVNISHINIMIQSIWISTLLYSSLSAFFGTLFKNNIATLGFPIVFIIFYSSITNRLDFLMGNLFTPNILFYYIGIYQDVTYEAIMNILQYDIFLSIILLFLASILFRRDIK